MILRSCANQLVLLKCLSSKTLKAPMYSAIRFHNAGPCHDDDTVKRIPLKWKLKDGSIKEVNARVGDNLLTIAQANDIDMEGACGGVCACSTCHVYVSSDLFDELPDASEEEEDMLDLAFALKSTSRLGCQVVVAENFAGETIQLPSATRNFYVDGHVPKPH